MANIVLPFVTTYDDKGAKKAETSLLGLSKTSVLSAISVGAVVDQLGKAVRAAADDQKAQELLEVAIKNNTDATGAQIGMVEDAIGKMQFQKAVSDGELRPALGNLVRATQDVTKAQELLGLALDISAGTGKSLESVSIALAKAQTGNISALKRLGIPLDENAVKSKDLAAIQQDLAARFAGASDAAANSAAGGMKKLQIALDEAYETVGNALLPVLSDYVIVLGDLAEKALSAEGSTKNLFSTAWNLFKIQSGLGPILDFVNGKVKDQADRLKQLETPTSRVTNGAKELDSINKLLEKSTTKVNGATEKSAKAKDKAAEAAKKYADTLRERVKTAVEATTDAVEKAQAEFDNYRDSLRGSFEGFASLADAFRTQTQAIDDEQEALRKRKEAYDALNIAKQKDDAEGLAKATQDLADAEANLSAASKKRSETNVISAFQKQIADAKKFSENLQYLVGHGLTQAGMAQLLNLGPVAGVEVTNEMISGSSGSFWAFQASMAELSGIASQIGDFGANAFFGGQVALANANQRAVNQYSITVQAGLVSNPAQVGRDIIEAIKQAERVSGIVFAPV